MALLTERPGDKSYKIYCMNFLGHYLDPIRKQFIKIGKTGSRRHVIVIDFDEERRIFYEGKNATLGEESISTVKTIEGESGGGDGNGPSEDAPLSIKIDSDVALAMSAIHRERQLATGISNTLDKERQFSLMDYWMESLNRAGNTGRRRNSLIGRKSLDKDNKKNRLFTIKEDTEGIPKIICTKVKPQRHNITGRPRSLLKEKFIEDEPEKSKIFIILVGKFENSFYLDLLSRGEPLHGIFTFFPDEYAYEFLVPNPDRRIFVEKQLERLEEDIYGLRTESHSKPTGIFRHFLPVISICLAEKYSEQIYDQLSWACYDVEILYRHYLMYYVAPFNEIDVGIPTSVIVSDTYRYAESLHLQGNYLLSQLPAMAADKASIILYMDMLFSTINQSEGVLTELEMILLSTPLPKKIYALYGNSVDTLAERYADAFHSITKIKKVDRLFLESNNRALIEMIQFVSHERFRHIYLACLEFKILRKYLNNDYHRSSLQSLPYHRKTFIGPQILPPFVRLYPTDDGAIQRLLTLLDDFDCFQITKLKSNLSFYHFRRNINEIIECNRVYVIPTRLCFRDFTLFQMEEFISHLVTPDIFEKKAGLNMTDIDRFEQMMRRYADDYNPDMFIRPRSLKARRMQALSTILGLKTTRRVSRNYSVRDRELQMASEALMHYSSQNNYVGLPPNHPLLTGYNLEDIRQEIWVKTSKYYFEEGNLQLYEERWCFTDTNKNLSFKVNDNEVLMGTPIDNLLVVKPQLRLTTKQDIAIRLYEEPSECAKVVINYPNGLSIYYQEHHTEQIWSRTDTPLNEKRRIITPFGAVIVEYNSEDLIVIMRYNGEVYRLYQYEFAVSEMGEEESVSTSGRSSGRQTLTSTRSKMLIHILRKEVNAYENPNVSERPRIPKEALLGRQVTDPTSNSKKRSTRRITGQDLQSISIDSTGSLGGQSNTEYEKEVIANELEFLKKMGKIYGVSYKHLIVTTSLGRVFNLMLNGKCYETLQLTNEEWHDYYANESYAMREDGVRMIWGCDYFKCYHSDGTVITTTLEFVYHLFENIDEFTNNISQSSSHMDLEESINERPRKTITQNTETNQRRSTIKKKRYKTYEPYLKSVGESEECTEKSQMDPGFLCVNISAQYTQHANYAGVFFLPLLVTHDKVHVTMEVKAIGGITVHRTREHSQPDSSDSLTSTYEYSNEDYENAIVQDIEAGGDAPMKTSSFIDSYSQESQKSYQSSIRTAPERIASASFINEKPKLHLTSPVQSLSASQHTASIELDKPLLPQPSENGSYEEETFHDVLKVWICNDFFMSVRLADFEIRAVLERQESEQRVTRDTLKFRFSFTENLRDIFQKIVHRISAFKKYDEPKMEEVFFLEKLTNDCETKGLEFIDEIPCLGPYHNRIGNTITEFMELDTIMKKFQNHFDWYTKDMAKFPRFRIGPEKCGRPIDNFPMVLSVNIFLKIPHHLRCIEEIHKFMDPLDLINFKKTRYQIKETMNSYLHPKIAREVHRLCSEDSWRHRHEKQQRQKLIEAQRMGLYHAILRHKRFPNYFLFTQKYNGKAKCIDYFDYCLLQCAEKTSSPKNSARRSRSIKKTKSFFKGLAESSTSKLTEVQQDKNNDGSNNKNNNEKNNNGDNNNNKDNNQDITNNCHSMPTDLNESNNIKWMSAHSV